MPTPAQIRDAIDVLRETAHIFGISDAFFVGGYPRAMAMGLGLKDVHDLDIATGAPDKAVQLAGFMSEAGHDVDYEILHRSGTVRLNMNGMEMDFQGPSAHEHAMPYLHAMGIEATPVALNVFDRDFTINSLSMPLDSKHIIDLTDRGMNDIEAKRVATIVPPNDIVPRDALVITRAIKFSHKYGFAIDGKLWKAMKDFAHILPKQMSRERLAVEAHTLLQYDVGETLKELGLEYLSDLAKEFKGDE